MLYKANILNTNNNVVWALSIADWICSVHMAELLFYIIVVDQGDAQTPHGIVILIYSIRIHMNEATKSNKPKGISDAHNIQTIYVYITVQRSRLGIFLFSWYCCCC